MRILCIGDVISTAGLTFLLHNLSAIKVKNNIDAVICNGENSGEGNGITAKSVRLLFAAGADVITTGNHVFKQREAYELLENSEGVLRPGNFPQNTPGKGWCILDKGRFRIAVFNLLGTVFMESMECPFEAADRMLLEAKAVKINILDFHAEASSEKKALGYYLDGRLSAIFGTHTHVQTADEAVLPNGTGYITDVGMTGPSSSVIGVKPEAVIKRLKDKLPVKFETATGECMINGAIFTIDTMTGKTASVERLNFRNSV
jgi:metallophosphoesterase (TIGR00282 family)